MTQQEQEIKDKLKKLKQLLLNQKNKNTQWTMQNEKEIEINNSKLDEIGEQSKQMIDKMVEYLKKNKVMNLKMTKQKLLLLKEILMQNLKGLNHWTPNLMTI